MVRSVLMKKKEISDLDTQIGSRIKSIRSDNKLSQEKMAAKIGVESLNFYQSVEKGSNRLSIEHCIKICDEFGVPMDFILRGKISDNKEFEIFFDSLAPENKVREFMNIILKLCGDEDENYVDFLFDIYKRMRRNDASGI